MADNHPDPENAPDQAGGDANNPLLDFGDFNKLSDSVTMKILAMLPIHEQTTNRTVCKRWDKLLQKVQPGLESVCVSMETNNHVGKVLGFLHGIPNLKSITFDSFGDQFIKTVLNELAFFENLTTLKFIHCILEDAMTFMSFTEPGACLPQKIYAYGGGPYSGLLEGLQLFPALSVLHLELSLTEDYVQLLTSFQLPLVDVRLRFGHVTADTIAHFYQSVKPTLQKLGLVQSAQNDIEPLIVFSGSEYLKKLTLHCAEGLNSENLTYVSSAEYVEELSIMTTSTAAFRGSDVSELLGKDTSKYVNLRKLRLLHYFLDDDAFVAIVKNCPDLRLLHMMVCDVTTVNGMLSVLPACPRLDTYILEESFIPSLTMDTRTKFFEFARSFAPSEVLRLLSFRLACDCHFGVNFERRQRDNQDIAQIRTLAARNAKLKVEVVRKHSEYYSFEWN